MVAKQFTVRLKNEPGALARLATELGEHGIDIRGIGAAAVGTHGCVVLTTSDDEAASEVLRTAHYPFSEDEVLSVGLVDRPGALADLTTRLAAAGVNVISVMLLRRYQGKAELGITVDNVEAAKRVIAR